MGIGGRAGCSQGYAIAPRGLELLPGFCSAPRVFDENVKIYPTFL